VAEQIEQIEAEAEKPVTERAARHLLRVPTSAQLFRPVSQPLQHITLARSLAIEKLTQSMAKISQPLQHITLARSLAKLTQSMAKTDRQQQSKEKQHTSSANLVATIW
jgi:hypothetical protein